MFWSRKAALEHLPGHRAIPARWGYGTKSGRKLGKTTIGDNGIILPVMKNGFRSLAYGLKFKGFVAHLEELNGPTIQRGVAETEFKKLLNELFLEYAADTKYKSEDKDKDLKEALDQVCIIPRQPTVCTLIMISDRSKVMENSTQISTGRVILPML